MTICKWREKFNQLRDNKQHFVASHRKTFKSIHGDKKTHFNKLNLLQCITSDELLRKHWLEQ